MNFDLSDEQRHIRDVVRDFAQAEIAPAAAHYDETGEFPYELIAGMASLGLFALPFSEEIGGAGGDFVSYCLAMEEIARADASCAITLEAAVSLGISPIVHFGSPEQQQRSRGDQARLVVVEPEAGERGDAKVPAQSGASGAGVEVPTGADRQRRRFGLYDPRRQPQRKVPRV